MKYISLHLGPMATNAYIVYNEATLSAVIFDPGYDADRVVRELSRNSLKLEYVFLTHGHSDHIDAVNSIIEKTSAGLVMCYEDIELVGSPELNYSYMVYGKETKITHIPNIIMHDQDIVSVDGINVLCLKTPGHTKGSCVYIIDDIMISGDTLFQNGCGRTDLYGGSKTALGNSLRRLLSLPRDYTVLPGHGPATTLSEQKRYFMI